jgi:type IV pilus assembly protein PilC
MYQVRDAAGRSNSGAVTAVSADAATQMLRKDGKIVVSLREESAAATDLDVADVRTRRIRKDDVIFFCSQLAVMVDTGVTLPDALDSIAEQTIHEDFRAVVQDLSEQVKSGVEFSVALSQYPQTFSTLFVAMMKVAEKSGTMGQMLQRISEYMEQERETTKKIKGAMIYPVCLLGFCVLVVIGLLVFVMPRFEKIYAGKGAALPAPTRFLLAISNGMIEYWPYLLAALIAAVVGAIVCIRRESGKMFLDRMRLNLPVLGGMYRKAYLARSMRTMGTMVAAGVSMLDMLQLTAQVAGNRCYAKIWNDLMDRVSEGSSLSEQLFACSLIPRTVTQMIAAGEKTGKLNVVMNRVAAFCEADLRVSVKSMTNMIEPIMIVVMGLIVGGIAIALLLPVFSISRVMAH